jgi:hypothetical protein
MIVDIRKTVTAPWETATLIQVDLEDAETHSPIIEMFFVETLYDGERLANERRLWIEVRNIKLEGELSDERLAVLWRELGDVPCTGDDDHIDQSWYFWPEGTPREMIWTWFDALHTKGVHDGLMYPNRE